mgnify:CR=1 FL=1
MQKKKQENKNKKNTNLTSDDYAMCGDRTKCRDEKNAEEISLQGEALVSLIVSGFQESTDIPLPLLRFPGNYTWLPHLTFQNSPKYPSKRVCCL